MATSPKFQAPKGTRDFFPPEMAVRRHIESEFARYRELWRTMNLADR